MPSENGAYVHGLQLKMSTYSYSQLPSEREKSDWAFAIIKGNY